ncbi:MAG: peptidoglycan glycosyltransferase, partial [Firmicutes bacterium]|nr:peptidoglycan glycosyltransferase [Bacillota bacterium]
MKPTVGMKKRVLLLLAAAELMLCVLCIRIAYIQTAQGESLQEMALEQQTRDRLITPERGAILDRNGEGLALNRSVFAVSVIHNQIENEEETA